MATADKFSYSQALDVLKNLVAHQGIALPSSKSAVSDPGATDAKYIKDLVTDLAEFFQTLPR